MTHILLVVLSFFPLCLAFIIVTYVLRICIFVGVCSFKKVKIFITRIELDFSQTYITIPHHVIILIRTTCWINFSDCENYVYLRACFTGLYLLFSGNHSVRKKYQYFRATVLTKEPKDNKKKEQCFVTFQHKEMPSMWRRGFSRVSPEASRRWRHPPDAHKHVSPQAETGKYYFHNFLVFISSIKYKIFPMVLPKYITCFTNACSV